MIQDAAALVLDHRRFGILDRRVEPAADGCGVDGAS
jgi:hypothetical protein